ncbi:MAG: hypothetical protein F6K30_08755 [Cyanothece sp. SIO2G6]|nr:hypothetical protein [Cyanothece sp. SIO2G6]
MRITDHVLLVEGRDDHEVIYQFCNYYGIDNQSLFSVEVGDGFDSLLKELGIRVRTEVKVLGIVIDADANLSSRWEEIKSALAGDGYILPASPIKGGTIIESPNSNRPQIGIWLMPDNQEPGRNQAKQCKFDNAPALAKWGDRFHSQPYSKRGHPQ